MHWWNEHGHTGWSVLWWIGCAVVVGAVLWAIVRSSRRRTTGASESADQILKRRHANGELDRETYERMLQDLKR